jgi:CheY-like chemotaxis protein
MFSGKEKSKLLLVDDESINIRDLTNTIDSGHEIHFANSNMHTLKSKT